MDISISDMDFGRSKGIRDELMDSVRRKTEDIVGQNTIVPFKEYFVDVFTRVMEPSTVYCHNWHIDYMCDRIEHHVRNLVLGKRREKHLLINVPPRTLKSKIVSVALNSWAWSFAPHLRFLTGSHSEGLAMDHSTETRKIIKNQYHKSKYGRSYRLLSEQDAKSHFANDQGGERIIFSVHLSPIGKGGDIISFDDAVRPPTEKDIGYLTTDITQTNSFFDTQLSTRLNDPKRSILIVVMQRLKPDDLSGHIIEKYGEEDYEWICLPAEAVKPQNIRPYFLIEKYTNGFMFEERLGEKELASKRKALGLEYEGQMNQDPVASSKKLWAKEMFIIVPDSEKQYVPNSSKTWAWDMATSKKQINSATAYVGGGDYRDGALITDVGYFWKEFPDAIAEIKRREGTHWIENKSSGQDAIPTLQKLGITAREWKNNNVDKIRTVNHTVSMPIIMERRLYVTESAAKVLFEDKIQGILKFPMIKKDDVSDALCIFIQAKNTTFNADSLMASITANRLIPNIDRKATPTFYGKRIESQWNL